MLGITCEQASTTLLLGSSHESLCLWFYIVIQILESNNKLNKQQHNWFKEMCDEWAIESTKIRMKIYHKASNFHQRFIDERQKFYGF